MIPAKFINFLLFIILVVLNAKVFSQVNRLLPLEIRRAYHAGTRSVSGNSGVSYWQNNAKYEIKVELLTEAKKIKGQEKITYFNNSPDSLKKIVLRLYPDLFRNGNARDWTLGSEAITPGTRIEKLVINGIEIDLNNRRNVYRSSTNLHVLLDEPAAPGDSIVLETQWEFDIPVKRPVRTGYYGDDLYFIAYWYPQIAVYDDIDGWDKLEYFGTVEFYNDFNDYDVQIKVPGDFKVWATGTLQNEKGLFTRQVLNNLDKARTSDEIVSIFRVDDCRADKVLKNKNNIWHFKAHHVPDFSFAAAQAVNWEGSSLLVDEVSNRKVFVDAVFADSTRTYDTAALWARQSVEYMTFELPGYPFPYSHMTTFCNDRKGGGMETPMIANNGDPAEPADAAATIFHEIAHTYFPFFMGTNERKYAWMDEG